MLRYTMEGCSGGFKIMMCYTEDTMDQCPILTIVRSIEGYAVYSNAVFILYELT